MPPELLGITFFVKPLRGLIVFAVALIVSILLSNIAVYLQRRLKHHSERSERIEKIADLAVDTEKHNLANWKFSQLNSAGEVAYYFRLTWFGWFAITVLILAAAAAVVSCAMIGLVRITLLGLFAELVEAIGEPSEFEVSVFQVVVDTLRIYGADPTVIFGGTVFLATITVFPVLMTVLLLLMMNIPYSLKGARAVIEVHHVLAVWCSLDVFVIALTLSALELPTVAQGLVRRLAICADPDLTDVIDGLLVPLGVFSAGAGAEGCLNVNVELALGSYIAVGAVILLSSSSWIVSSLFAALVAEREHVYLLAKSTTNDVELGGFHGCLKFLGLIRVASAKNTRSRQQNPVQAKMKGAKDQKIEVKL